MTIPTAQQPNSLIALLILLFFTTASYSQQRPRGEWEEDINTLRTEIPKRFDGFFDIYPEEAWNTNLDRIIDGLGTKGDLQVGLEVQAVAARAKDSYFRLDLTSQLQTSKVIPIGYGWYKDGLFISGTIRRFARSVGKRVVAFNGQKPEDVLEKVSLFLSYENEQGLKKDGMQLLRFPVILRLAGVTQSDTISLTLEDASGERQDMKIYPINFREISRDDLQPAKINPKDPDLRWQPVTSVYRMDHLKDENILYFQYNYAISREMLFEMGDSLQGMQQPAFTPFADSIVSFLQNNPDGAFVFDLRFNSGGNPSDGIQLSKKLQALDKLKANKRVFALVNSYTAAAPVEIAEAFRENIGATILGEPSSERPGHNGQRDFLVLPNTEIQVFYPIAAKFRILRGRMHSCRIK